MEPEEKIEPCDKCGKPGAGLHECPFASEINDNHDECNCCPACVHICCDEI